MDTDSDAPIGTLSVELTLARNLAQDLQLQITRVQQAVWAAEQASCDTQSDRLSLIDGVTKVYEQLFDFIGTMDALLTETEESQ